MTLQERKDYASIVNVASLRVDYGFDNGFYEHLCRRIPILCFHYLCLFSYEFIRETFVSLIFNCASQCIPAVSKSLLFTPPMVILHHSETKIYK